ncbi:glycosyltransferase family 2 protein [Cellulomonas sp. 73-145]|uniref:glycosyltransferase family 2 protein n=1 Tax=unclassified Cellulomonas TaxID=2620175 RepID=UPI001AD2F26C|nr:glycosyltransferase family 2 protein [Cellulomonas sp. 73-145]MBN9327244.1 glycosyltransferase family 2 protein [Cellulomonas sp.]
MRYSIVIPVYGNEATLGALIERLTEVSARLDGPTEAVFVVDGSPDGSLAVLRRLLPEARMRSQVVVHSRNFGSFPAIRTGLATARGEYLGVMAADLQEPPELMESFFSRLASGECDVAVGRRESRSDPAVSSIASRTFWWLYRRVVNPAIPRGGVDVFGCTREVAGQLLRLDEAHSSLVAQLYWIGYRRAEVPYERRPRPSGRSGWTFRKRVRYLLDSVFAFTDIPISVLTTVGFVGGALTTVAALIVFVGWLMGRIVDPGYTPLMLVLLFSTFTLLSGLGIVGSYVWRTFENSKARPVSIAMSVEGFDGVG